MTQIAYVLKMYPRFSETFIVNEILELERQGVDVRIYSLRKPDDGRFHASLARVKAGVVYVPQYPQMEPERVQQAHELVCQAFPESYRALRADVEARARRVPTQAFRAGRRDRGASDPTPGRRDACALRLKRNAGSRLTSIT